jgi:hypothetical protein
VARLDLLRGIGLPQLRLFPHLGSRFYHLLAGILSPWLRELISPA